MCSSGVKKAAKVVLPAVGAAVGSYAGPWGTAAGSALGTKLAGGSTKEVLASAVTAGAGHYGGQVGTALGVGNVAGTAAGTALGATAMGADPAMALTQAAGSAAGAAGVNAWEGNNVWTGAPPPYASDISQAVQPAFLPWPARHSVPPANPAVAPAFLPWPNVTPPAPGYASAPASGSSGGTVLGVPLPSIGALREGGTGLLAGMGMGMAGGGAMAAMMPTPPTPTPPEGPGRTQTPSTPVSAPSLSAASRNLVRRRALAAAGRSRPIATSPQGILSPAFATRKRLLGR